MHMETTIFCNLGSIIIGLVAWIVPVIGINLKKSKPHLLSVISFSFCAIALLLQLVEIRHRVMVGDWSALMDTVPAIVGAAAVLVLVTIFINILILVRAKKDWMKEN